jgi:hypothetical protein
VPTNYIADQTDPQPPSALPSPEATLTGSIPVDGDLPTGSLFSQAFKVAYNFIDWLLKPIAKASDWDRSTMAYRIAIGHKRFAVDHMGFPSGLISTYEAIWCGSLAPGTDSPSGTAEVQFVVKPDWRYKAVQSSGGAAAAMSRDTFGPVLFLVPGNTAGDYTTCSAGPFGVLRTDNHVALDTAASVPGSATRTFVVALCDLPISHILAEANFIGFRVLAGGTIWQCVTKAGGVETVTNTAVTANVSAALTRSDRLRIEWHGSAVSDNGSQQVRFYINGNHVATHTTTLPVGMFTGLAVSDVRASGGSDAGIAHLRPMRLRASLHDGDSAV